MLRVSWREVVETVPGDADDLADWFNRVLGESPGLDWDSMFLGFLSDNGKPWEDGEVEFRREDVLTFVRSVSSPPPDDLEAVAVFRVIRERFRFVPRDGVPVAESDVIGMISQALREYRISRDGPRYAERNGGGNGGAGELAGESESAAAADRGTGSGPGPGTV